MSRGPLRGGGRNAASGWARFRASRWLRPLAIAVPIVVVLGAGLAVYLPWELSKATVPDLAGKRLTDASEALGSVKLTLQAPAGTELSLAEYTLIDSQDPAPGTRVLPNTVVTVTTHLGHVTVPDVSGKSFAEANGALQAAGLSVGQAWLGVPSDLAADSAAIDAALATLGFKASGLVPGSRIPLIATDLETSWPVTHEDPAPGAEVVAGSGVSLTVTVPFARVPDVGGQSKDAAIATLKAAGFDPGGITADGVVTAQTPAAGTLSIAGAAVDATLRHQVRYEASGTFGRAWMQWTAPGSSEITVDPSAKLPWSMTWWDTTAYGHVVVGPKAVLGSSATASCRILVDGVVVSDKSAIGTTPNVTCG